MSTFIAPHFDIPFRIVGNSVAVVEQDSVDDVAACCIAILVTHVGWRDEAPTFGVHDFSMRLWPLGASDIDALVIAQEPRAGLLTTENLDRTDQLIDIINIGVSTFDKRAGTP